MAGAIGAGRKSNGRCLTRRDNVCSMQTLDTMLITIDADDPRPLYQQVADGIRELIASGGLVKGAPLPPVRQLATDLSVNMNTIATAYRTLQDDGLIAVRHGAGSVVASCTITNRTRAELLSPLRPALTQLVLADWPLGKILEAVKQQIHLIKSGSR